VIVSDVDPCLVSSHVKDAVRDCFADGIAWKIVDVHFLQLAFRLPLLSSILEVSDQLLLLGVDGDDRLISSLEVLHRRTDVLELRIAVRMICPLSILTQHMQTVPEVVKFMCDAGVAHAEALLAQFLRQISCALARPAQW
jgi:hypothetical protein